MQFLSESTVGLNSESYTFPVESTENMTYNLTGLHNLFKSTVSTYFPSDTEKSIFALLNESLSDSFTAVLCFVVEHEVKSPNTDIISSNLKLILFNATQRFGAWRRWGLKSTKVQI